MRLIEIPSQLERTPLPIRIGASLLLAGALILADGLTEIGGILRLLLVVPVLIAASSFSLPRAIIFVAALALVSLIRPIAAVREEIGRLECVEAFAIAAILVLVGILTALLKAAAQREQMLSGFDELTGAVNRRAFDERLNAEINRCGRAGQPLTLAFVDCDRFKQINELLGHAAGDEILKAIVAAMRANTRSYDAVARVGGDEFVVLLPEADETAARTVMERIQRAVGEIVSANDQPVSVSIGVVTDLHSTGSPDDLLRAADRLMYAAKREGTGLAEYGVHAAELTSSNS